MAARIFRPAKTAMQSGKAKTERWRLVFDEEEPRSVEPLMGYTSAADMNQQVRLSFDTLEEAIAYATRRGIPYEVEGEHDATRHGMTYSENFRPDRRFPWTH